MFEPDGELFDQALTAELYFLNRIEKRKQTLAKLLVELTGFDPSMNQRIRDLEEWRESQKRIDANLDKIPLAESHNEPKRAAMSNLTGIQSGAFEAKLEAMRKKLSDRLSQGLTKIDGAAEAGAQRMEAAVDNVIAKVDKEIEDKLQEFATLTNGGPA